ncbi:hypothetical protein [Luteibacter sp.]|uniref:hypothetical protein n=1 Tax=Luteibacter sp. TaxID=1886636 RepID=UPI002809721B|nr:hypothetical protein [Luteibacter sp.]MDQ8051007.1 hypothetical protein [Luteibacter sp.]
MNTMAGGGELTGARSWAGNRAEMISVLLVFFVSLLINAWMPLAYPAVPVSDFGGIVEFAALIADKGPFAHGWYWNLFSAGTPTLLSVPLALSSADDVVVARIATVLVLTLVSVLPMLLLRNVVPLWARLTIALAIALMPARIVFSGVIAQDNWVQLPVVALACLAVRNLYGKGRGYPAWSALLWCLSLYVRQEMLVAALPLALLAAWPFRSAGKGRAVATFAAVGLLLALAAAGQRQAASGDFALTSRHGGVSLLGSYVPGAGFGWVPYDAYVASRAPELAADPERLRAQAGRMALDEIKARPGFHLLRRLGAVVDTATGRDGSLQYWALAAGDPSGAKRSAEKEASASKLAADFVSPIIASTVLLHALFLAAAYVGFRTRDRALIALFLAVGLKAGIHFVFAVQARFFLVVYVLEAIAIGLALVRLQQLPALRRSTAITAVVALAALALAVGSLARLGGWVEHQEAQWARQLKTAFQPNLSRSRIDCQLVGGRVRVADGSTYSFVVGHDDPEPGEFAELRCLVSPGQGESSVVVEVEDKYAPGGFPDRMIQVVTLDGQSLLRHDVAAEAGNGWWSQAISLQPGQVRDLRIRVEGLRPDKGPAWGSAAETAVRFKAAQ